MVFYQSVVVIMLTSIMVCRRFAVAFQSQAFGHRLRKLPQPNPSSFTVTGRSFFNPSPFVNPSVLMTTINNDEQVTTSLERTWNIAGLKKEVARLVMRSHKKVGKASTRLTQAQATVEELNTDPNATIEDLEKCPNVDDIELEVNELQERLAKLNQLEQLLEAEKKKTGKLPKVVVDLAIDLGISDEPPPKQERGPGKKKGPKLEKPRKPYRKYYSLDKTEIRVGKRAEDNDQLSCSPEHRDGTDWWMHASGCPGSHIIIRSDDPSEPVIQDAAALAARHSKCSGSVIPVSLTRCRDVKKPPGAKAGLVQLTGKVRTVNVNMKEAEVRLARLDETCDIN